MTTSAGGITLTSLLPFPYVFAYSIPLFVSALLLTFAGAFLSLCRTCTFPPHAPLESLPGQNDVEGDTKSRIKAWWGLEGGVGGLASGWIFGAYVATFLSLLIMNRTSSAPLSPAVFLFINLMSSVLFCLLSGRFKLAALACIGVTGGVSFALILTVVLHPTLLIRLIFVAILTPLFVVATLLPVTRTQHRAVRFAAASSGAFGSVVSIALLAHILPWSNVWERLWMQVSLTNDWGTGPERGLSAAACILLAGGIASDWALTKKFGENPDQKWDAYLTQYAATLPYLNDRAGTFQPPRSLWQRIFGSTPLRPIIFPSESDLKPKSSFEDLAAHPKAVKLPRNRVEVKFQPLGDYSDSDSESESERNIPLRAYLPPQKPWVSSTSFSGATLYGSDDGKEQRNHGIRVSTPRATSLENYSDSEGEDITTPHSTPLKRSKSYRDEPGWKPEFLSRHDKESESQTDTSSATAVSNIPPGAVPLTPSLIRAIDRIGIAQGEAYRHTTPPPLSPGLPRGEGEENWRRFWDRVQEKAYK